MSPDTKGFCHRSACETFSLAIANLSLKKGSPKTPFSTSNCVIRCHDWLRISHSLGLSPFRGGFCQQTSYLSVACGGTIPLLEFWSSNSSTLCLDGFLTPLHSSNCVSACNSWLYIGSGAGTCVGLDDSSRSPLPNTCIHSMCTISAPLPSHLLTSAWSIDSIMGPRCCVGLDDLSRSPLPFACTSLTLAFLICYFSTCILSIDFSKSSRSSEGLSASQRCTLPFTCTSLAHVFYLFLSFVDLRVTNWTMKSSVLLTLLWLSGAIISSIYFAAKLWHYALALVGRCHDSLCQIGLLDLCHSLLFSDFLCDSDGSLRATCALLRHDFCAFILGRVIRTQPLPDTSMTIGEFQEDAHAWASDIEFEEINSTNPFSSSNSPHSLSDCDFATACTFYTTFNPCFHSSEQADENGLLPPILDTGATHCLLPLRWLTPDQAAFAKRIHLKVASGTSVRALLYNNLIYCKTVSRPLISVGQLKAMLDVRFIWSDSSPLLVACSGGLKYILVESAVIHHLPVISSQEMTVILEALHDFTSTGTLWNAATWSQHLGRKLALFHWSSPTQRLPPDHAEFTDDPQVMFSSMACDPSLEETPLLPSLQIFPLPSSSSSSSYRSFPAASSDALPSSSVITFNLEDHDPPTEDEEMTGKEGANHSSKDRTVKDEAATSTRDDSKRGSDSHSSSQSHLCHEKVEDRKETRSDRTDENFATNGTATSGMDNAFAPRNSKDRKVRFASHTTSHITELESVQSSVDILLQHKLPKARQRTNVVTQDYTPRGRLFGGYTTRGEGVTMASYRFPEVVSAIHSIAATRPSGFADEPYLSAQLNSAMSLPIHKDKNNHSMTWLIALGDFTGGRLWIESPVGTHPPPLPRNSVEKKLRGEYLDTKHTWICFDPQLYHAVEPVTSGVRVSLALFTPKGLEEIEAQLH